MWEMLLAGYHYILIALNDVDYYPIKLRYIIFPLSKI